MSESGRKPCPGEPCPGEPEVTVQLTSGNSKGSRPARTFHLQHTFDPQPLQRRSVAIRPPSPRTAPPRERPTRQSFSCEPEPQPIIRRRSRSLPPSTEKKAHDILHVRFVDSLGLELERVKLFEAGEDPTVPAHVMCRLLASSELASGKSLELSLPYIQPSFPENMAGEPSFLARLCCQRVCLENVYCSELGVIGSVQVLNLAFEKEVTVHYSFTDWKSANESKACWASTVHRGGGEPESDVFRFRLPVPAFILQPNATLQFAICFRVLGEEFWDNNDGHNYKLVCRTYKLIVPKECEASMVHFM
ncbi:protein phosphatase 1, regulatory subunit 3Db [Brachyhypopomus gauderio]|uniref:protein phosphatase 1, regulatory subunit 3Db n=1 Tax=Brachyhypopomus gauderio TaxID=698409 RepID=UPI00404352E6